jgi:hypothetical protein
MTEETPTSDQTDKVKQRSLVSCLPKLDSKTIEVVGADAGDASSGRQT